MTTFTARMTTALMADRRETFDTLAFAVNADDTELTNSMHVRIARIDNALEQLDTRVAYALFSAK